VIELENKCKDDILNHLGITTEKWGGAQTFLRRKSEHYFDFDNSVSARFKKQLNNKIYSKEDLIKILNAKFEIINQEKNKHTEFTKHEAKEYNAI